MPENAGIQCDSVQIRVEQERSALEAELRQSRIRLAQVEERLTSISSRRQNRSRNEVAASRDEADLVTFPPSPVQPSPSSLLPDSPASPATPAYSPSSDIVAPPPVDYQPRFDTTSTDPDIRALIRTQFPDLSTFTRTSEPTPRTAPVSRSKRRRERRKRLRDARAATAPAPPPAAEMVPEVKNNLGIISIRRKDFLPLTVDEVAFVTDNIQRHGTDVDARNSTSIYKNTLRIFCDSKVKLQNVWESTKQFPELPDHPGFCFALPGIKFSDLTRIECRLPPEYFQHRRKPAPLVDQFLAGCPGFDRNQVKFVRLMKTKFSTRETFVRNKSIILIMDVSEGLWTFIRSKSFVTKLDKKWKVRWRLTKREKEYRNKVYKKVENVVDYWERKRFVSFKGARNVLNSCYDFRCYNE